MAPLLQFSPQSREGRWMPQGYTSTELEAELPDRVRRNKKKKAYEKKKLLEKFDCTKLHFQSSEKSVKGKSKPASLK